MIQTTIKDLERYSSLNPYFSAAFKKLFELSQKPFETGTFEVDGDNAFIKATQYETRSMDEAKVEAHRNYIDVMWLVSGEEKLLYYPTHKIENFTQEYNEQKDVIITKPQEESTIINLKEGDVVIFFPEDSHAPNLTLHEKCTAQKYIAKVKIV